MPPPSPRPTMRSSHGSLREGGCRAPRGWGRVRKEKCYKVVNLARRGLLPSRLCRATSLPEGGEPSPSRLRAPPLPTGEAIYGGSKPPPYDIELSHFVTDETSPQRHIRRRRNFIFRKTENFTLRREQAPALRYRIFSLRRRRNFTAA